MAVVTLGSSTGPTVVGGDVSVTTGVAITTLPVSSPITIQSSGNHADSLWQLLPGNILAPDTLTYKVGLGAVDTDTLTDNYILLYDDTANEIKKIASTGVSASTHTHAFSTVTATPTTLSGYGITDAQPLDADLTGIAALNAAGTVSFLKKTGSTWSLDSAVYSAVGHTHAYQPTLPITEVNDYVLSGQTDGTLSWIPLPVVTGGGGGEVDLSGYAPLAAPVFTTSFGFATTNWRLHPNGNNLEFKFNTTAKITFESDGDANFVGDVVAYAT